MGEHEVPADRRAQCDACRYLAGLLEKPETTGETYDIGGPEVLTYRQIMDIMAEELKLPKRVIIPLPILTPTLSSYWIHLVTPLNKEIARPLAEGLRNPVVARDDRITRIIPARSCSNRSRSDCGAARSKTAEGSGGNELVDGRGDSGRSGLGRAAPCFATSAR